MKQEEIERNLLGFKKFYFPEYTNINCSLKEIKAIPAWRWMLGDVG
jgi:hypothetical protein